MAICLGYHHVLHLLPGLSFGCRLCAMIHVPHNNEITKVYRCGFHSTHIAFELTKFGKIVFPVLHVAHQFQQLLTPLQIYKS